MPPAVRVVVSCTDRKKSKVPAELQLRGYPSDLPARASAWIRRLENPSEAREPASDLYQGEHWAVVKELPDAAACVETFIEVWVASAGYGLIRFGDLVEPYSATFTPGAEDAVTRRGDQSDSSANAQYWWRRLAERTRPDQVPSTLAALAASDRRATLIVALSGSYVRAIRRDLEVAATELLDPCQLLLVSGGTPGASFNRLQVPVDARFQHTLGGTRMSLNVRVAKRIVELAPEHGWDGRMVRQLMAAELEQHPEIVRYERHKLSDEEVVAFIEESLANEPTASRSSLLRRLRDLDMACEQKRFGQLFDQTTQKVAS